MIHIFAYHQLLAGHVWHFHTFQLQQEKTKAFINSSQLGVEYHIMIESLEDAIALVKDLGAKYKVNYAWKSKYTQYMSL